MSFFSNLSTEGLEEAQDRLGGFQPFATDSYDAVLKAVYAGQSDSGARNVTVMADVNGREFRETIYITNSKGENFFLNKQDNSKKVPLPGFTTIDDLCLMATGLPLSEQPVEEKTLKLYDRDAGGEIPKNVPVLVDLVGKTVTLGILQVKENKTKKNDSTGKYEAIAEEREYNTIDKVFHFETKKTVYEARNNMDEATFHTSWVERNKGEIRDKREIKDGAGGTAGRPGAARPAPAAGQQTEKKKLFA